MWKSIHSLLLPLVLMSGSLVTCDPINLQPEPSPSITSSPLNPDQGNLDQENLKNSFDDIQKTNNEFQTLLDDFIKDIAAVREGSKNRESVNSSKVNEKLIQLEEKVNTYKNQISQIRNQENLEQNFNSINQNISNIKQITEKLKGGLVKTEEDGYQFLYGDEYKEAKERLEAQDIKAIDLPKVSEPTYPGGSFVRSPDGTSVKISGRAAS